MVSNILDDSFCSDHFPILLKNGGDTNQKIRIFPKKKWKIETSKLDLFTINAFHLSKVRPFPHTAQKKVSYVFPRRGGMRSKPMSLKKGKKP